MALRGIRTEIGKFAYLKIGRIRERIEQFWDYETKS